MKNTKEIHRVGLNNKIQRERKVTDSVTAGEQDNLWLAWRLASLITRSNYRFKNVRSMKSSGELRVRPNENQLVLY